MQECKGRGEGLGSDGINRMEVSVDGNSEVGTDCLSEASEGV